MNGIEVIEEMGGKGRGLVASQPLRGGQIILKESPILLYSAFPFTTTATSSYCANCFKRLVVVVVVAAQSQSIQCTTCLEVFCSPRCSSSQKSHSPWVCQALSRLRQALSVSFSEAEAAETVELHQQSRFLVAAYNLAIHSPSLFQTLLSLHGSSHSDSSVSAAAQFLHPLIITSTCFSVEMSASLLSKDKLNAFGLMEPFQQDDSAAASTTTRSVRAYGIYPNASLFNHDCLPNACRFDYVDTTNTDITIRMIHDVPAGREICLSYFPVNLSYTTRQKRLLNDYGFTCHCDRCKVEANWSDQEEDDEYVEDEEEGNEMADMEQEEYVEEENEIVNMEQEHEDSSASFPHAYFFVRYMCNRNNCGGTLAPLPNDGNSVNNVVMECNVCGNLQTQQHHP